MRFRNLAPLTLAALSVFDLAAVQAHSPAQWRSQSIYQVLTDRFARTDGSTTAAYFGTDKRWLFVPWLLGADINQLNQKFGTVQDLKDLSAALHARGMYLMVDVVTNHMAYAGCGACVDYSTLSPFNSLVSDYSIDGLRIDSVQQVNNNFWPSFQAAAGGMHVLGEVFNGDPAYVCPYQTSMTGLMNFPAYYWITQGFQSTSGSISNLVNGINTMKLSCSDTTLLGSFLENHDVARFPSLTSDLSLQKNAIAFTMLMDGIPIINAGQEQGYRGGAVPSDREATWLSGYNTGSVQYGFVKQVTYVAVATQLNTQMVLLKKGAAGSQTVGVFTNKGASSSAYTLTLNFANTGFTANQAVIEVLSCPAYTADSSGNVVITMSGGLPRVLYPSANLSGSGICSALIVSSTSATVSTTFSTVATATTSGRTSTTVPTTSTTVPTTSTTVPTTSTTASTTSTTAPTTSTTAPTGCSSVAVTFNKLVTTIYGTNIKIVGSIAALGSWNTANGVPLSASKYTSSNPLWSATINFAPGTYFEYKFIMVSSLGAVTWESGSNRVDTVAGTDGMCTQLVSTSWK
ncbi:hypothetical protein VE01_10231 [Pseudogymnoascus verrucosus]|uniref:alpha-amylase n=1 Tax=Pseudogymnoascus verrucosus TaxID=342668 RepID=A0A1B8G7F3_9PEZI|nr:uncharacterized protein VE01_10231 [Pseudogymnoascus verrucosus]OBT91754.1 hypothetical protein VE01_10231 [Pseudogymnoascus verrucosus]